MTRLTISLTTLAAVSTFAFAAEPITEQKFQELMKEASTANKRFKDTVAAENSVEVSKDAKRVAEIFTQMAAFWKEHKLDKPATWSTESATAAKAVASAADTKDWAKVKESTQGIAKNCKNCHDAHREKVGDNYKFKY